MIRSAPLVLETTEGPQLEKLLPSPATGRRKDRLEQWEAKQLVAAGVDHEGWGEDEDDLDIELEGLEPSFLDGRASFGWASDQSIIDKPAEGSLQRAAQPAAKLAISVLTSASGAPLKDKTDDKKEKSKKKKKGKKEKRFSGASGEADAEKAQMMKEQDDALDELMNDISKIKEMAFSISSEIQVCVVITTSTRTSPCDRRCFDVSGCLRDSHTQLSPSVTSHTGARGDARIDRQSCGL
jgi:hypothetical protein